LFYLDGFMTRFFLQLFLTGLFTISFSAFSPFTVSSAEAQSGGYFGQDYDDRYSGDRDYRDDYREQERREEMRELDRERRQIESERRALERERAQVVVTQAPVAPAVERCPSGFQPSENKCSTEERRRGCKDMRLPGGLGCVRR